MRNTNITIILLHLSSPISAFFVYSGSYITTLSFRPRETHQINQSNFLISNNALALKLCKDVNKCNVLII